MQGTALQLRARPSGQSSAGNINQCGLDQAAAHTASAFIAQRFHSSAVRASQGLGPVLWRAQDPSVLGPADSRSGEADGERKATGKGEVTARAEQGERSGERDGEDQIQL